VKCPSCSQELTTVRSYQAGDQAGTSELSCSGCQKRFVFVKVLVGKVESHGQGAYAIAQKLRRGELSLTPTKPETK